MLKVGEGAIDIIARNACENFCNHAHFPLNPRPFGIILLLGHCWQEFLGCVRLETSGKSTKTDYVASYS